MNALNAFINVPDVSASISNSAFCNVIEAASQFSKIDLSEVNAIALPHGNTRCVLRKFGENLCPVSPVAL
jgi:hypothetical protein